MNPETTYRKRCRPALQVAALALALLSAGCSSLGPRAVQPPSTPQAALARPYHRAIELGGRLSVHYQQHGKDQAVHGSFSWNQNGEQVTLALFSPLGQTMATIEVTPQQATLQQNGQPPRIAADADALAADALGWPLPLSGLRDWLQGYARDASGKRVIASAQQDEITTSDGWHLRFVSWQHDQNEAAPYPRRLDLARNTDGANQAGEVALRIVIDQWHPR